MAEGYLQIMIESLEKKIVVLDQIMELNVRQAELSSHQPMDMEAYDKTMDEKGTLIDEINKLDDGFTSTYKLVKDIVQQEPEKYRDKVLQMQELIRVAVEKGVTIEAQE
ncbi:MAG: flagellar protein FliT, partial [Lachnospiraceae bacterium]|nr:flagellar protein FliT [Lachnospiraceae bacterium]